MKRSKAGDSLDSIMKQYSEAARPMFFQFIEPSKSWAEISTEKGKIEPQLTFLKVKINQLLMLSRQQAFNGP